MRIRRLHGAVVAPSSGPDRALPARPLEEVEWNALVSEMEQHRTVGFLSWTVGKGAFPATDAQRAALLERHARLMHHALVLEDEARRVVAALRPHGVEPVVVKGVAAAHLDHDEPSLRVFQDVDVLVHPSDIDTVVEHLLAAGCTRDLPPRRADWDRRFAKDIALTTGRGAEIDLHRAPVPGPFGFAVDLDELHADTVGLDLGGTSVRALGPERRVISSALALTVGEPAPRLAASLDMLGVFAHHSVDVAAVTSLAERWRAGSLLAEAVRWTARQLGAGEVPGDLHAWATSRRDARWERWWRRAYRSASGSNTTTLLAGPLGMAAWDDRRDYLRGLIFPDGRYRQARAASARPREWRTGLIELLGRQR